LPAPPPFAILASAPPLRGRAATKYGFNLLLWTTHVTPDLFPTLAKLMAAGYDGIEAERIQWAIGMAAVWSGAGRCGP